MLNRELYSVTFTLASFILILLFPFAILPAIGHEINLSPGHVSEDHAAVSSISASPTSLSVSGTSTITVTFASESAATYAYDAELDVYDAQTYVYEIDYDYWDGETPRNRLLEGQMEIFIPDGTENVWVPPDSIPHFTYTFSPKINADGDRATGSVKVLLPTSVPLTWFSPARSNFDHDNDPNTAHHSITTTIGTLPPRKKTGFIPTVSGTDYSFTFDATVGTVTFPQSHTSGDVDHDSQTYTPAITITKRRFKQEGITLTPSGTGYSFTIDTGGTTQSITSDNSIFDPQPGDTAAETTATIEVDLDSDGTDDVSITITRRRTAHATLKQDFGDASTSQVDPSMRLTTYFGLSHIVVQNAGGSITNPFVQVGDTTMDVSGSRYTFTIQATTSGTYTLYVASSRNAGDQPLYSVDTASITVSPSGSLTNTAPPIDTTDPLDDNIGGSTGGTTDPPVDTTDPPVDTTDPPVDTTDPPVDTTDPPDDNTDPPDDNIGGGTGGGNTGGGTSGGGSQSLRARTVIFNEVANKQSIDYEWIELRNTTNTEQNIKNWRMSIVTLDETQTPATLSETRLFDFGSKDVRIPAQGVLLLPFTDPSGNPDHPLAGAWNIDKPEAQQVKGVNAEHSARYLVLEDNETRSLNEDFDTMDGEGLPNDGEYLLVLRSRADTNDTGKVNTFIQDVAGYSEKLRDAARTTSFASLLPTRNVKLTNNTLAVGEVHYRQKTRIWGVASVNYNRDGGNRVTDTAFRNAWWTGIGYKRNAANIKENAGTPGYANNAFVSAGQKATEAVIISEIMFNPKDNLPQWIELQNMSQQIGVNLYNWSLFIVNHSEQKDGTAYTAGGTVREIKLSGRIPPGQTYLIVSQNARHNTRLPRNRIKNTSVGAEPRLLNPYGFRLTLKAKTNDPDTTGHQLIDDVGNLPDVPANALSPNAQSLRPPAWSLPSGVDVDGNRVAIARRTGLKVSGTHKAVWVRADLDPRTRRITDKIDAIYYGRNSDIGSPGATVGSVLPVALSVFRPERLESGEIVIRWVTESETNNAGFHILRSETRQGPFTQLNPRLIAGQGTTSERTTYVYPDTTAKPHGVYYYQLQDVSFDGEVMTGRITPLRGNVSAAGKLTTTWSALKVQF